MRQVTLDGQHTASNSTTCDRGSEVPKAKLDALPLFEQLYKGEITMFETIKNFLQPQQRSNFHVVTVSGPVDYESIPLGFFRVVTALGKESLGYRGSFISWRVGKTVVDGAQRHTCETPLSELPTVRLNYQRSQYGDVQIGGCRVIDTDSLDADRSVVWDGAPPANGVGYR